DAAEILWDIAANTGWVPPNNKVATVKVDYSYNIVAANKFNEQAKQKGFEIVVDELHQFGVVEWGPIISKIEQTQPAFITFWNCDVMDASRFMIQLRDYLKDSFNAGVYMQFTPCTPEFKELTGEAANGLVWSTGGILKDTSEYDARFENLHGGPPQGMYAYWTYDAFQIWLEAVKKVGDPFDYDAVCQAIRKTDYQGFIGRVVFREEDQSAIRGDEYIPLFWYQIWDGKDVAILPEKSKEGEFRLPPWIRQ
ncbi:ABC transporter substrate-binding protein, partial [bacterium]|nr:ABC transporter substrate-binding protein [bacterium]